MVKEACDVLRAYLMDNDKEKFELLYEDMILVIHDISDNSGRTNIDKGAMMRRITALQAELDPSKFNFEGHGGLNDEQVTLWFRVKFWLCSTFKAILNAVGLRSAANFFTPAPSANEQNTINTNLQNLTNAVGQFKDTLNNTYPDPDSDSDADSGLDSNIRHS